MEDHVDSDAVVQGSTSEDGERSQDEAVRSRTGRSEQAAVHDDEVHDVDGEADRVGAAILPPELIALRVVAGTRIEAAHIPGLATRSSFVVVDAR